MRSKLSSCIFACILVSSASAAAAPYIATSETHAQKTERRTEVNLAMLVGGTDIGSSMRSSVGVQVTAGRRYGDLALLGELGHFGLGDGEPFGTMDRLGLVARYSLLRTEATRNRRGAVRPVSGDYWFEGGVGAQRITWDDGGKLTRPELILGFGWQINVVMDRKSMHPRYYGPYVAFRASVARAPQPVDPVLATCAGPCDDPSGPPRTDVSMFFHLGINWGR